MVIIATLCYIVKDGKILLIKKKRGFGAGKFNAPGGKVEDGESIEQSVVRELEEEIDVVPMEPQLMAEVDFFNDGIHEMHVYVFRSEDFEGEPKETDEATPHWFSINDIPYGEMWADDKIWLPLFLEGKKIKGRFYFKNNWNDMTEYEIEEVS